jgi:hypothetical protein
VRGKIKLQVCWIVGHEGRRDISQDIQMSVLCLR